MITYAVVVYVVLLNKVWIGFLHRKKYCYLYLGGRREKHKVSTSRIIQNLAILRNSKIRKQRFLLIQQLFLQDIVLSTKSFRYYYLKV